MMGIIVGENRVEFIQVKKRDLKKHFFVTRDQLYKFYPNCMKKMRLEDDLGLIRTESVMIYPENGIRPYGWAEPEDPSDDPFDFDTILGNIDEHKRMVTRSPFSRWRMYLRTSQSVWRTLAPLLPILVAGIVLVGAFTGVLN
ncbi:MAG: hypothetical protein IKY16_10785 [Bacteroidales bacterium]|nr:hypothetical protein [Bacteroidales bacterium]